MCHPRYTFKVGLNLRRYEVPTYTHFNPYNAPYRALPPDSISLFRLGSSTHGYHGCLLVPSSGESHFLPHKSPCADSTIAPTHHFTGCFHHPKKQQCQTSSSVFLFSLFPINLLGVSHLYLQTRKRLGAPRSTVPTGSE